VEYRSSAVAEPPQAGEPDGGPGGPAAGRPGTKDRPGRAPWWARLLVIFGALLMVASGGLIFGYRALVAQATKSIHRESLLPPGQDRKHVTINGAKNILLIGIDSRPGQNPNELVRADSIIILHIPAAHDRGFMVSIPRDTHAQIPPNDNGKHRYDGGYDKINAAFAYGGQGLTGAAARQHASVLLEKTITNMTGITFDAVAIVDFDGFRQVVNVLGGVYMCVDERTTSVHNGHDKNGKVVSPAYKFVDDVPTSVMPGVTPIVYEKGCRHFEAWEALDYVRQRDKLANGDSDYGRQRHQQQFLKAIFKEAVSSQVLTNYSKLTAVLKTVGNAMTLDDGNIPIEDWVFAMKGIGAGDLITIKTNNGQFRTIPGTSYESLDDDTMELLRSVKSDTVEAFISNHQSWVAPDN
jgi:LCP family protein required for cell wall assembly